MRHLSSVTHRRRGIYVKPHDESHSSSQQPITSLSSRTTSPISSDDEIRNPSQSSATASPIRTASLSNSPIVYSGRAIEPTQLRFTPLSSESFQRVQQPKSNLPTSVRGSDLTETPRRHSQATNKRSVTANNKLRNLQQNCIGKSHPCVSRYAIRKNGKPIISCNVVIEAVLRHSRNVDLEYLRVNTNPTTVDKIERTTKQIERFTYGPKHKLANDKSANMHKEQEKSISISDWNANKDRAHNAIIEISRNENSLGEATARKKPKFKGRNVESNETAIKELEVNEWNSSIHIDKLIKRKKPEKSSPSLVELDESPKHNKTSASTSPSITHFSVPSNSLREIVTSPATVKSNASTSEASKVAEKDRSSLLSVESEQSRKSVNDANSSQLSNFSLPEMAIGPTMAKSSSSVKSSKWLVQAAQLMEKVYSENIALKKSVTAQSSQEQTSENIDGSSVPSVEVQTPRPTLESNYLSEPQYNHPLNIELRMLVDGMPLAINFEQNFLSKSETQPEIVLKELLVNHKLIWPASSDSVEKKPQQEEASKINDKNCKLQ